MWGWCGVGEDYNYILLIGGGVAVVVVVLWISRNAPNPLTVGTVRLLRYFNFFWLFLFLFVVVVVVVVALAIFTSFFVGGCCGGREI